MPENVDQGLANCFVKGSNWLYIDATPVAPANFANTEFQEKPR